MELTLPTLSPLQYNLVYNFFSLAIASMLAGFIYFSLSTFHVGKKYRGAMMASALVVAIAAYHYFRIFGSWTEAYALVDGMYEPTGALFNEAYRYVDWLLTVPLLMVETVLVLSLSRSRSNSLIARLAIAATLMIALGYPGEIATSNVARFWWGLASTIPFAYILWVLWVELGSVVESESGQVKKLFRNLRLLLLGTWGVYPIAYMFPFFGLSGAAAFAIKQVGYTIADILAKPGYGMLIHSIAEEKMRNEQGAETPNAAGRSAAAGAASD